jgi:isopenicillin N synthase-like dioxygenase
MESMEFPIISLANIRSDFDHVTKQLFEAACKWGFFIITDHGITKAAEAFALVSLSQEMLV